jgi:ABC-type sugar transport system permease subunit
MASLDLGLQGANRALTPITPKKRRSQRSSAQTWGAILIAPYVLVFLVFVLYPVTYGLWLARNPASYQRLFEDPVFFRTVVNTIVFLLVAVNLKFVLALFLSGFFVHERRWIRWLSVIFIIPWAVPSIPTIFSIRFMLNPEWGVVNSLIFRLTQQEPRTSRAARRCRPAIRPATAVPALSRSRNRRFSPGRLRRCSSPAIR